MLANLLQHIIHECILSAQQHCSMSLHYGILVKADMTHMNTSCGAYKLSCKECRQGVLTSTLRTAHNATANVGRTAAPSCSCQNSASTEAHRSMRSDVSCVQRVLHHHRSCPPCGL
jgi:hypothetical protein